MSNQEMSENDRLLADFFSNTPAPAQLDEYTTALKRFVQRHVEEGTKVVLITSGGTTVPLERNTVRYLDNFSGGGRGSASAEYFLEKGYAVIFLHRRHSLQPYGRHFLLHKDNNFLDYLNCNETNSSVEVIPEYKDSMYKVIQQYHKARDAGRLLKIAFQSIHDYLFFLRETARALSIFGEKAVIFSAAAVSDFFIPASQMVEHKIQSGPGGLVLKLEPVPKLLGALRAEWATKAFIVSFKLETDESLLAYKAKQSLTRYQHQLVIGNLLQNHKDQVVLFPQDNPDNTKLIMRTKEEIAKDVDIEKSIIEEVVTLHEQFISKSRISNGSSQ